MHDYLKYSNIEKSLKNKGFTKESNNWVYRVKGKISFVNVSIKVLKLLENNYPEFSEEIPKFLLLDRLAFKNLIDCSLSEKEYLSRYIKPKLNEKI